MAISQEQKVDFLLKKIGFTKTKTGLAVDSSLSGTKKAGFAEALPSPLIVADTSLWTESGLIPTTPPGSDTSQVKVYLAASSGLRLTVDSTVAGNRAFLAYTTYNNTSSARLTNWIDTQFGNDYLIKVYKGDPNSGGVALSASGSGANDGWFFDYSAGVLNFNDTNVPSGVTGTNIYIVGYRYIGNTGALTPGDNFRFTDLVVDRNFKVGGISTFNGIVDINSDLDVDGHTNLDNVSIAGVTTTAGLLDINAGGQANTFKVEDLTSGRVVLAGTGGELEDSSNLTFNGSNLTVGGNVNAVDGVFSGNVTIGGTLTYEDVTNVDAVGFVTARDGLVVVGGGASIAAGGLNVTAGVSTFGGALNAQDIIKGYKYTAAPYGNTTTITVTVADKTAAHRYNGQGSSKGYVFDGLEAPFLTLTPGRTYKFDQSHTSNSTHQIKFYLEADKTGLYETGVTYNGTAGNSGAYTQIVVSDQTPVVLHYMCINHGYMGNAFQTNANVVNTNYDAVLGSHLNVSGVSTFGGALDINNNVVIDGNIDLNGDIDVDGHTNLDNISVAGISTFAGRIVGAAVSNVIPFYYDNTSQFPSASTYHGAFAHAHNTGRAYFAHAGWKELVNVEANGVVGTGTQRYNIGALVSTSTTATSLNVTGVTTAVTVDINGDLDVDGHTNLDNINVAGVTTFAGEIDANGRIVGAALSNVIPFYYDNTGQFPSASTYHGAVAHAHNTGRLYFAHAGWKELVNVESNGVVGTGTQRYNIGALVSTSTTATSLNVSGVTTAVTVDVNGDLDVDGHTNLDNVSIAGVTTFASTAEFDGTAKFDSTITAGGGTGTNGQYLKTTGSGVEWASFPTLRTRQTNTASAGQTTFTFSYTVNFLDVFVNGIKLTDAEFTATNGSSVVLAVGCFAGDIVELVSYNTTSSGGGGGGSIAGINTLGTSHFNNINAIGVITATKFVGDGSLLTNVIGSGSGVVVKDSGTNVGTAGTIDFGANLSVSPISAGIVTITGSAGSGSTAEVRANTLEVLGVSTFASAIDLNADLDVDGHTNLDNVSVAGVSTFAGNIVANGNIVGDNSTDITGINAITAAGNINANGNIVGDNSTNITGIAGVTATTLSGTLQTAAQTNITSVGTLSSLNVSGNVSIGGTLTYEDVTNIDAVGLITARNGIDCNGDIDVDGHTNLDNVNVAGVATFASTVNATTFVGALTGNVTGNASGSSGSCTGNSATATEATNVTVTANNSTNETVYPLFVDGATGTQGAETDTGLNYNPSTGNLAATKFTGSGVSLTGLTGASAATYGNATAVPQIVVDSNGRITGITNVSISGGGGGGGTSLFIRNNGSLVGAAGTIDFGTNLNVSALSAGIVTVTAADTTIAGINTTGTSFFSQLSITGMTTTAAVSWGGHMLPTSNATYDIGSADYKVRHLFLSDNSLKFVDSSDTVHSLSVDTGRLKFGGGLLLGTTIKADTTSGIITATTFSGSGASLTSIPAGQLTGTVADARISTLTASKLSGALPAISGANLTNLDASDLASGTVPDARFPATLPAASGANLTALNASNLASGTVPDARFPATLPAVSGANLTNLPAGTPTNSDIQVVYTVTANGSSAYRFAGNGVVSTEDDPDLYLIRGQKYRFVNNSGGSHPFQIREASGGTAYSTGVTNNGAASGNIDFAPTFDSPAKLVYQCTNHGSMVGNIYIRGAEGNENNVGVITATSFSGNGASLTALNASNIGSGTVPTARLASGTANSSTYLRGDQTWASISSGITTAHTNIHTTWDVGASGSSHYTLTGPGLDGAENDPTIYVVRGQRYRFVNNSGGSHPFQIRYNAGGNAFSDGVTNNGASSGNIEWNVQYDTPDVLYYQCTNHSSMLGKIIVLGDVILEGSWTASAGSANTIDTISTVSNNNFKTAEYTLHFTHSSGIQAQRVLAMQDGSNAYSQEYAVMNNAGLLVSVSASISSGNFILSATPETGVNGSISYKITRKTMR